MPNGTPAVGPRATAPHPRADSAHRQSAKTASSRLLPLLPLIPISLTRSLISRTSPKPPSAQFFRIFSQCPPRLPPPPAMTEFSRARVLAAHFPGNSNQDSSRPTESSLWQKILAVAERGYPKRAGECILRLSGTSTEHLALRLFSRTASCLTCPPRVFSRLLGSRERPCYHRDPFRDAWSPVP